MERFCTNCGNTLEEGAMFCPECGQKVELPSAAAEAAFAGAVFTAEPTEPAPAAADVNGAFEEAHAKAAEARKAEAAAPVYTAPEEPEPLPAAEAPEEPRPLSKADRPVSTAAYFWLMLLFAIPGIGLLLAVILAFAARKKSLRNFARANLIWVLVALIIAIIGALVGWILLKDTGFDFKAIDFEGLWSGILKSLGLDSVF